MKILMVCLGNICRSPLAEGILRRKIEREGLDWQVDSAGTNGLHDGEAPHRLSQKVAGMNGLSICDQVSRRITPQDFKKYDRIFAMAGDVIDEMKWIAGLQYDASKVDLLMNLSHPGRNLDVPDPWYGGESGYHEVYKLIDQACERLILKEKQETGNRI